MRAEKFRIVNLSLFERPVVLRLPFRFGAATVTQAPQAFVRARIQLEDGREAHGAAAELMVPKWFDKSLERSNQDNVDDLRRSLSVAADAYSSDTCLRTAFGHFAARYDALIASTARNLGNALLASYGPAVIDRAIVDALCRALGLSFAAAMRANVAAIDASLTPDLDGFDLDRFLAGLGGASHIAARHTVGMLDPLTASDIEAPIGDGMPQSLVEVIERYGNRYFKLKLTGNPASDVARLVRIAAVLDAIPAYAITLDGNEQFASTAVIDEFWRMARTTPALARLVASTRYLEQPLPRASTLDVEVTECAAAAPMLIDESDATLDAFPSAHARGYTGVSSKSCKGFYKSLLNAARCAKANTGASAHQLFLSAEDLTMQAGLAVQQDLALAALLGLHHVERNGHHYVNGFAGQGAGDAEQRSFLSAHPDLYERHADNVVLAIRDGKIALGSLARAGFAGNAEPPWRDLQPISNTVATS
jgi:L-alanine-DL-glutamate epimerase-like enolase superfamily enzyme